MKPEQLELPNFSEIVQHLDGGGGGHLDEGEVGVFEVEEDDGHAAQVPFSSRNLKNICRKFFFLILLFLIKKFVFEREFSQEKIRQEKFSFFDFELFCFLLKITFDVKTQEIELDMDK